MDLVYVPIEPIPYRYSESWYANFPAALRDAGFTVTVIDGEPLLDREIKTGTFLDVNSTVHYKMTQLREIARGFHEHRFYPNTVFFFADAEFWGLESVRLMAQMNGVKIKMAGFLHAASYTAEDAFSVAAPYQQYTELGWLACLDKVFVGSLYHLRAINARRLAPILVKKKAEHAAIRRKIIPTGNPLFLQDYGLHDPRKHKHVLLTNRFDSEKRPGQTLDMFRWLKQNGFEDWKFIVTTSSKELRSNNQDLVDKARWLASEGVIEIKEGLTKEQYHDELAKAAVMVSHSIEENYGYCIAEAMIYRCVPVLRQGLSHDEFLGEGNPLLFRDFSHAIEIMQNLLPKFGTDEWPKLPQPRNGLTQIVRELVELTWGGHNFGGK